MDPITIAALLGLGAVALTSRGSGANSAAKTLATNSRVVATRIVDQAQASGAATKAETAYLGQKLGWTFGTGTPNATQSNGTGGVAATVNSVTNAVNSATKTVSGLATGASNLYNSITGGTNDNNGSGDSGGEDGNTPDDNDPPDATQTGGGDSGGGDSGGGGDD